MENKDLYHYISEVLYFWEYYPINIEQIIEKTQEKKEINENIENKQILYY